MTPSLRGQDGATAIPHAMITNNMQQLAQQALFEQNQ